MSEPSPTPAVTRWLPWLATLPALGFGAWLTAQQRFLCDDAFISFRYARNLLEGHGLTFNPGEWVEGYTNFLWVLQVALLWTLGVQPPVAAQAMGVLATVATVALVARWASRAPGPHRAWAASLAVVLLATERSFAVWAWSGLETRQFTMLLVAGLYGLSRRRPTATALGSAALAAAALTRPEGLLWAGLALPAAALDRYRAGTLDRRMWAAGALPFLLPVGLHLLWRRWTYGMWVPNTYVAKHVSPWVDMGLQYLGAVSIEAGLWLIVPVAAWGLWVRARARRSAVEPAAALALLVHLAFVLRVGGDHFEWRPLDPWWPLLALWVPDALLDLGRRLRPRLAVPLAWAGLAVLLLYGRGLERAHDRQVFAAWSLGQRPPLHVPLNAETAPIAARIPGMAWLLPPYERWMRDAIEHGNAIRQHRHRSFANEQLRLFGPYLPLRDQLDLPTELVTSRGSVGIMPFSLPDLEVIDVLGLTDATVAANPVQRERRHMAHDRRPPKGYLQERGVNARIGPAYRSLPTALAGYTCAIPVGERFFSFSPTDMQWALQAFRHRELTCRDEAPRDPAANTFLLQGRRWQGVQLLGAFERGDDGWTGPGLGFARRRHNPRGQRDISGVVGTHLLDTFHRSRRDEATAHLISPTFEIPDAAMLGLHVGGGSSEQVGVVLKVDGQQVRRWTGTRTEAMRFVWLDLQPWAGQTAHLEVIDTDTSRWGHVTLDHAVLYIESD